MRGLLPFGVVLGVWAGAVETGLVRHRALAGPIATFKAIGVGLIEGGLLADLIATLLRVAGGVAIGLAVALPLGLWIGVRERRRRTLEPALDFLRAIPPLLIFPLMLLSFGYGDTARVGTVAYAAALVASLHIATGASRSRSARERTLLAIGATGWQMIRWLRIYEALPHCLSAIRQAVSLGLVVAVVTEMVVGAPHGLGTRAVSAQIAYDVPGLYGVILLTGAVGYVVAKLLFAVERRTLFWRD